ncbi:MAG: LytTR family DNA-binding domain-containing protein [Ferruginibacter sp.]
MKRILIIEDEEPAARRLVKMLQAAWPDAIIETVIKNVEEGIAWFQNNEAPSLIFSDIQLTDGNSFDIFAITPPSCPVIFITAYDEFALKAFQVNSIDYLLKPLKQKDLDTALEKFSARTITALPGIDKILQSYPSPAYKQRFVVRYGEHIKMLQVKDVAYFYTEDKVNFIVTMDGRRYVLDYNLDSLEAMLDPDGFFRINRQFIISIQSIEDMFAHTKSRILIKLSPPCKIETIVSTERSPAFKLWLGK